MKQNNEKVKYNQYNIFKSIYIFFSIKVMRLSGENVFEKKNLNGHKTSFDFLMQNIICYMCEM